MSSLLKSCKNTRSIIPGSLKYIRSDVPSAITEDEIVWLLTNDIRCIIDLRSEDERKRKPCPLEKQDGFCYYSMPVTGGNTVPANPDLVSLSYINMVDEQMKDILELIHSVDCNILYFCNAGKDRTGVVSALLLKSLGYDNEIIINDYLLSGENLREELQAFAEQNSNIDLQVITPKRRYMEEFLTSDKVRGFLA